MLKNRILLVGFVLLAFPLLALAESAFFYISPHLANYNKGDKFFIDVMLSIEGTSLNAAEAVISFPADKLSVVDILKVDSIFSLWIKEPEFSNMTGEIYFVGGLPSPGFIGEQGKVFTVLFEAKDSGKVEFSFSGEKLLANDPEGKYIPAESTETFYYINQPGFDVSVDNRGDLTNPRPLLYLAALDADYYEVELEDEVFKVEKDQALPWQMPVLEPGEYLVLVRAVSKDSVIENATKVMVESIEVPKISFCQESLISGQDSFYVSGSSLADSYVLVDLTEGGISVAQWKVKTDSQGSWFLKDDGLLRPGVYEVTAKTLDLRGALSYASESRFVSVSLSGFMLGPLMITYKSLAIVVIVLLIVFFNWLSYLLFRTRRTRNMVRKESKDLRVKFYKEYNELKEDIEKQLLMIKEKRQGREADFEEKELEKRLLANLKDVEDVLERELKDIEIIN